MNRIAALLALVFIVGCSCAPDELKRPDTAGKPWDTAYLIDANPALVTNGDLLAHANMLSDHYWQYNQVEGVLWPGLRSDAALEFPDQYGTGGDSGIFTGFATAGFCFNYAVRGDLVSKDRALRSLRGLYWLTHVAGRGVIARCAFPLSGGSRWRYPGSSWEKYPDYMKRAAAMPSPLGTEFPESFYYTRATKDQLTGILFGLTAAWRTFGDTPGITAVIAGIVENIYSQLKKFKWYIRDKDGNNATNADKVDGMMRLQLEALRRHTIRVDGLPEEVEEAEQKYRDWFHTASLADLFNKGNNYQQYYAHNLRSTRALCIWMLEDNLIRKDEMAKWMKKAVWRYVRSHQHGWAAAVMGAMFPGDRQPKMILRSALQSLSLKPLRQWGSPYAGQKHEPKIGDILMGCEDPWVLAPHLRKPTNYWTWQKRPWDVGSGAKEGGLKEGTGVGFMLPYWMGRYFETLD